MELTIKPTKYYYLIMPQQEILINQVLEEILRERTGSFLLRKKLRDFWLISAPKFIYSKNFLEKLEKTNFYTKKQKLINEQLTEKVFSFYGALVSTDESFMKWISLRLGYFEDINNPDDNTKNINCDGVFGSFEINENSSFSLNNYYNYISPKVKRRKYDKIIEIYYDKILQKI
jgi:hypothetical protein